MRERKAEQILVLMATSSSRKARVFSGFIEAEYLGKITSPDQIPSLVEGGVRSGAAVVGCHFPDQIEPKEFIGKYMFEEKYSSVEELLQDCAKRAVGSGHFEGVFAVVGDCSFEPFAGGPELTKPPRNGRQSLRALARYAENCLARARDPDGQYRFLVTTRAVLADPLSGPRLRASSSLLVEMRKPGDKALLEIMEELTRLGFDPWAASGGLELFWLAHLAAKNFPPARAVGLLLQGKPPEGLGDSGFRGLRSFLRASFPPFWNDMRERLSRGGSPGYMFDYGPPI